MHPTAITGQMDLGSWLSEMWILWLSVLKPIHNRATIMPCVKHSWFHSAFWVVLYKDLSAGDF